MLQFVTRFLFKKLNINFQKCIAIVATCVIINIVNNITNETENCKMKKMLKRLKNKIIIPKNERDNTPISENEFLFVMFLSTITICGVVLIAMSQIQQSYINHERGERADKCRIQQFVIENDEQIYLCVSVYDNETTYMIYPHDSKYVDNNPYLNRPVTIYKNGTFK